MKFSKYGFIMIDPAYTQEQTAELKAEGFSTTVYCVQDIEMACKSAKKLAEKEVHLIELCGAFRPAMVDQVIEAVDGKIAVGNISMREGERAKFMDLLKS